VIETSLTQTIEKDQREIDLLREAMLTTIRSYLAASTIDEKLRWSRNPNRVRPMMQHHYKNNTFQKFDFDHISSINFVSFWSRPFVLLMARSSDGKGQFITLEQTDKTSFRVDWETDVYYQPMLWDEFIKRRPTQSMDMRVWVKPENLYTFQFRDEKKYECFRLTSRDSSDPVYGYVERGSPVWKDLRRFFELRHKSSHQGEPLLLRLRFPTTEPVSSSDKGVIIEKFLSDRWLYIGRKH